MTSQPFSFASAQTNPWIDCFGDSNGKIVHIYFNNSNLSSLGCIEHCGCRFDTEKDLLEYLTMDLEVREQQRKEYEELLAARVDAQAEQEKTDEVIYDDLSGLI